MPSISKPWFWCHRKKSQRLRYIYIICSYDKQTVNLSPRSFFNHTNYARIQLIWRSTLLSQYSEFCLAAEGECYVMNKNWCLSVCMAYQLLTSIKASIHHYRGGADDQYSAFCVLTTYLPEVWLFKRSFLTQQPNIPMSNKNYQQNFFWTIKYWEFPNADIWELTVILTVVT